jgi:hypothetical protein
MTIAIGKGSEAYCDGDIPVRDDEVWRHVVHSAAAE